MSTSSLLSIPLPSNRPVTAAVQYVNPLDPSSLPPVKAFAKLAGYDWTYYITTVNICIGRGCDLLENPMAASFPTSSSTLPSNLFQVDVDLGPAKTVSRRHATILYNFETSAWELTIFGRNGLKIDFRPYKPSNKCIPLQSG
ncbi:transcription factor, partial [Coelomomyces lativittatus]